VRNADWWTGRVPSGSPVPPLLPEGAADVPPAYLEDASGLKGGHAERVIVPADDEGVAAALRQASAAGIAVTVSGAAPA